jgi:heme/copper-type cytochrome/quinol oxidase subunit 2
MSSSTWFSWLARARALGTRIWLAGSLSLLLAVVALVAPLPWPSAPAQERRLELTARRFEYDPGTLRVNRGDTVIIKLQADDAVHGLYVDGYDVSAQAEPGQPAELKFVASETGAFHIRCSVPCGNLHPFMIGKLIVGPNLTWLRAVLASLVALTGALVAFWRS